MAGETRHHRDGTGAEEGRWDARGPKENYSLPRLAHKHFAIISI
jgi:hypothetical protein